MPHCAFSPKRTVNAITVTSARNIASVSVGWLLYLSTTIVPVALSLSLHSPSSSCLASSTASSPFHFLLCLTATSNLVDWHTTDFFFWLHSLSDFTHSLHVRPTSGRSQILPSTHFKAGTRLRPAIVPRSNIICTGSDGFQKTVIFYYHKEKKQTKENNCAVATAPTKTTLAPRTLTTSCTKKRSKNQCCNRFKVT